MAQKTNSTHTYIAVDIGGTKVASGFVSLTGHEFEVTGHMRIPTQASLGGSDVLRRIVELVERQYSEAQKQGLSIDGIGIGSAGVVDSAQGRITSATDLMPGWAGQHVAEALGASDTVGQLPVYMVGDVGAHGLGEALHGAGAGYTSVLSISIGTGIGGAYISDGQLMTGAHGVAGHAGHIPHGLGTGVRCSCGTTSGHIEPVASGTGLGTLYNLRREQAGQEDFVSNGAEVVDRMNHGDEFAHMIVKTSATALGECIGGMANLLDPSIIILSGSVVNAGEVWWEGLRTGYANSALVPVKQTPLVQGVLGDDAPLVGAASAVHRHIFHEN
ncbi:ROK family protein [Alloscardovia criceti]|uniref:ROK family protein n=1 Tax=Alloscardovia criceti TaxID=356828 RepID=UPI0003779449|nr:ROK family protein [Alloscardovia criceti]